MNEIHQQITKLLTYSSVVQVFMVVLHRMCVIVCRCACVCATRLPNNQLKNVGYRQICTYIINLFSYQWWHLYVVDEICFLHMYKYHENPVSVDSLSNNPLLDFNTLKLTIAYSIKRNYKTITSFVVSWQSWVCVSAF